MRFRSVSFRNDVLAQSQDHVLPLRLHDELARHITQAACRACEGNTGEVLVGFDAAVDQ
ncbi:MAG: hypothetical protein JRF54_12640 [Deltaproteobacteria bacterium]|nr:hypothetical protein [Deltaproteobacteria bacterium]